MDKGMAVRKFKKNDFSSDFEYDRGKVTSQPKKAFKKKHRSVNPNKSFDHLRYEE